MAIVFDSDAGTITGLSVGGLPDGTVDNDTLASNAVTTAKIVTGTIVDTDISSSSELNTVWTDHTSSSTITGWSSFTTNRKWIFVKVIGHTLHCAYHLEGTANATSRSFTLPNTLDHFAVVDYSTWNAYCYNNGSTDTTPGLCRVNVGTNTVNVYRGLGGSWTSSGTSIIAGSFTIPIE